MLELTGAHPEALAINWPVLGLSLALALAGLAVGWLIYGRKPLAAGQPDPLRKVLGPVYPVLENRYYIDEFYQATVIRAVLWLSAFCTSFDAHWVIDPIVNGVARAAVAVSNTLAAFDFRVVDGAVNATGRVVRAAGQSLRQVQTGKVQEYLLVAATTVLLLLGVFLYL
jgi:NADH-quinone oxidoreductase subunit L